MDFKKYAIVILLTFTLSCSSVPENFPELVVELLSNLKDVESTSYYNFYKKYYALKAYNSLRELLKRPTALSLSDIDKTWIQEVTDEAFPVYESERLKEKQKHSIELGYHTSTGYGASYPSPSQIALIEEARRISGIEHSVIPLSTKGKGGWAGIGVVALCSSPDLDDRLYTVYHELGHIAKNHVEILHYAENNNYYTFYLENPVFKQIPETVNHYIGLATRAIDSSSEIGRRINQILAKGEPFWNPPDDPQKFQKKLLSIIIEQQADLFALKKLWEKNHLNTILWMINQFSVPGIANEDAVHPSGLKIALYTAGFLIANGIDINKALRDWDTRGQCLPTGAIERTANFFIPAKTRGALDFLKVYSAWQDRQQAKDYQEWKTARLKEFETRAFEHEFNWHLVWDTKHSLKNLKDFPDSTFYKLEALYSYNLLRERLGSQSVKSIAGINLSWLGEAEAKAFHQMAHKE